MRKRLASERILTDEPRRRRTEESRRLSDSSCCDSLLIHIFHESILSDGKVVSAPRTFTPVRLLRLSKVRFLSYLASYAFFLNLPLWAAPFNGFYYPLDHKVVNMRSVVFYVTSKVYHTATHDQISLVDGWVPLPTTPRLFAVPLVPA